MTLSTECFLAHAATIGINGKGVLLTGPSGSGKSTTAAAAALSGLVTILVTGFLGGAICAHVRI
jgi:serine kinase of HPr protein (carbohydrate metabolism regulator)